jgi:thiamine biosynthesis lipoprotein
MTLVDKLLQSKTVTGLLKKASFLVFISVVLLLTGCDSGPEIIKISGSKMGTTYHVTVVADQPAPADLAERIDAVLDIVDHSMSTYKAASELSQFNDLAVGSSQQISADFARVLAVSKTVWERSGGAFDPTVGPLVDLWGFGPIATDVVPEQAQIDAAKAELGFQYLTLNNSELAKSKAVRVDLSAVAKGYAVDLVADLLEMLALPDYLVEVGGEMRLSGSNPEGMPWRVAIELPSLMPQVERIIEVQDMAVATSGDYRNYFEQQGVRYSHTIDPRTGRPITHSLASVTVLAEQCADADAWATAFMVLGDKDGMALANELAIPLYMLVKDGAGFKAIHSRAFEPYLNAQKES